MVIRIRKTQQTKRKNELKIENTKFSEELKNLIETQAIHNTLTFLLEHLPPRIPGPCTEHGPAILLRHALPYTFHQEKAHVVEAKPVANQFNHLFDQLTDVQNGGSRSANLCRSLQV